MSLTAVKPDREVIDGLLVDAAWERAKDLEAEIKRLQSLLKRSKQAFEEQYIKRSRLERGLWEIINSHRDADRGLLCDLEALLLSD